MSQTKKWVYLFAEGRKEMRDLLGGKGANLCEMTKIGLPVPPGFIITTEACNYFLSHQKKFPQDLWNQVLKDLSHLEKITGKKFGDPQNPLLVSVRSGAKFSMPGMMETVLNLGLNAQTLQALAKLTGNERFCFDAYRRFIQMFGKTVIGIKGEKFETAIAKMKEAKGVKNDTDLNVADLQSLVREFQKIYQKEVGQPFPQEPLTQLKHAIEAVFGSWNIKRAIDYRNFHKIPHDLGTAVSIVTMVFGNMGTDSGTGVAFTRNPSTGQNQLYGEYLMNAQGEDVVAGIRTPIKIDQLKKEAPKIYRELRDIARKLEKHYCDVQDLEFTIEKAKLWMLQTRNAKRTAQAAVKIAVDLVKEGLINKKEAVLSIEPGQVEQLLHPRIDPSVQVEVIARGLNASPGAATGKIVFDADDAETKAKNGEKVILVRPETNPDDMHGMLASQGILTARGGMTSHAAVVARGLGKPCIAGCEEIKINLAKKFFKVGSYTMNEGDLLSINGTTGEVIKGKVSLIPPEMTPELKIILGFADEIRKLGVLANADIPADAQKARDFGAEGIGLCRTEHMFFDEKSRPLVVKMIMSATTKERQKYLNKILPFQRSDFEGLFKVMNGLPVVIRLIDPPMHEFLPPKDQLIAEVAKLRCLSKTTPELTKKVKMLEIVEQMWEVNPMLGLRGCRLGIIYPEISKMQVTAIMEAACRMTKKGIKVYPKIMIPLVSHINELRVEQRRLEKVAEEVMKREKVTVKYSFGTMIELPRAALLANQLAQVAQFFSFGTNDLTQMTFGLSRDDAEGKFLFPYLELKIYPDNPFATLDQAGVGKLIEIGVQKGRQTRPKMEIGICGEHGGDPASIDFCHRTGLTYVSCSPFRVPIARLAAAQAALKEVVSIRLGTA